MTPARFATLHELFTYERERQLERRWRFLRFTVYTGLAIALAWWWR